MSTVRLSTPPVRVAIGNDSWYAREKIADGIGNLNNAVEALQSLTGTTQDNTDAINGNLSFGDVADSEYTGNMKAEMFVGTGPAANTAFTLTHTLGKVPNGAILIQSNVAAILYGDMTDQAWTSTTITLLLNQSSVNYVILVLG